jgi:uncharacterized membrane protein YeaQ/YmgE (transglycosylase-associated protein family)
MRPVRVVIAVILGLAGLVWMAQGLGVLPGTAMSGSIFWAIVGAALVVVAVAMIAVERRRASAAPPPDAPPPATPPAT